ncbi:flagellar motor switch protein FliN [Spirochaetia bacterium]|nr:flagellar motor switch protein FliN [Spirochaetia bacterium]
MSDGALSQDEIDALLAGVDSSSLGGSPAASSSPSGSDEDRQALQNFLSGTVDALSSNLSMMTGSNVNFSAPELSFTNRDTFLEDLPETVTVVKADFSSGFPGEHIFILSEDTARAIASLMNKEDNIELDEMALSVIAEAIGTIVGAQITSLTGKTGNKSIGSIPPNATNVPKAVAALPSGDFVQASYDLNLGDGSSHKIWEIYDQAVAGDIARSLSGPQQAAAAPRSASGGMGGGMSMGGMGGGGMAAVSQPTNVQSVQFPSLIPQPTVQEQGNIGLIMDVYMEMTVELGRTRKLIKEILGMGEGTIIELDKLAGEPVDILVNHKLIAKGEVVVIDENFGVRVTEIVSPMERMSDMN